MGTLKNPLRSFAVVLLASLVFAQSDEVRSSVCGSPTHWSALLKRNGVALTQFWYRFNLFANGELELDPLSVNYVEFAADGRHPVTTEKAAQLNASVKQLVLDASVEQAKTELRALLQELQLKSGRGEFSFEVPTDSCETHVWRPVIAGPVPLSRLPGPGERLAVITDFAAVRSEAGGRKLDVRVVTDDRWLYVGSSKSLNIMSRFTRGENVTIQVKGNTLLLRSYDAPSQQVRLRIVSMSRFLPL